MSFILILYLFFGCDVYEFCRDKNVRGASQNIRSKGNKSGDCCYDWWEPRRGGQWRTETKQDNIRPKGSERKNTLGSSHDRPITPLASSTVTKTTRQNKAISQVKRTAQPATHLPLRNRFDALVGEGEWVVKTAVTYPDCSFHLYKREAKARVVIRFFKWINFSKSSNKINILPSDKTPFKRRRLHRFTWQLF